MTAPKKKAPKVASPFDRVRPRTTRPVRRAVATEPVDAEGKRALFSTEPPVPALGSVIVECSRCEQTSVLSLRQAARAALPSLHLPFLHGRFSSFMRCPACGARTGVRARLRV